MNIVKKIYKILRVAVVVAALAALCFEGYIKKDYEAYKQRAIPALMYHSISEVPEGWARDLCVRPEVFEEHLRYLQEEGYHVITAPQAMILLKSGQAVPKTVILTFDDGYDNNYTTAYPLLKKYGFAGNFYAVGKDIGQTYHQDGVRSYMTIAQLKEMRDNGMEIGSHSMSHDNLTKIAPHFLPWEIYQPLNLFYEQMGFWLSGIAFPNGAYNELVLAEIRKYHKYEYGFSGEPGANTEKIARETPFALRRIGVYDRGRGRKDIKNALRRSYVLGYLAEKRVPVAEIEEVRGHIQDKFHALFSGKTK